MALEGPLSLSGRYLDLLRAGSSDHPMTLLARAGVDLSQPETVQAIVDQLDHLVTRLEQELDGHGDHAR